MHSATCVGTQSIMLRAYDESVFCSVVLKLKSPHRNKKVGGSTDVCADKICVTRTRSEVGCL